MQRAAEPLCESTQVLSSACPECQRGLANNGHRFIVEQVSITMVELGGHEGSPAESGVGSNTATVTYESNPTCKEEVHVQTLRLTEYIHHN